MSAKKILLGFEITTSASPTVRISCSLGMPGTIARDATATGAVDPEGALAHRDDHDGGVPVESQTREEPLRAETVHWAARGAGLAMGASLVLIIGYLALSA